MTTAMEARPGANGPTGAVTISPWGGSDAPMGTALATQLSAEGLLPCHVSLPAGHREPYRGGGGETIWLVAGWMRLRVRGPDARAAEELLLRPGDRCDLPAGFERTIEVLGDQPAYFVSGRRLAAADRR
jgi:hypothetical protein